MAGSAVKIANLQIEITDNTSTVIKSLSDFIEVLRAVKESSKGGAGLSSVANGLKKVKEQGTDGIDALKSSLSACVTHAEKLAESMAKIADANGKIGKQKGLSAAQKVVDNYQQQIDAARQTRSGGLRDDTSAYGGVNNATRGIDEARQKIDDLRSKVDGTKDALSRMQMNGSVAYDFKRVADEAEKASAKTLSLGDAIKKVGSFGRNVFGSIIPSSLTTLGSQILRLAKMKVLRTMISNVMKGFTEGLQNAYQWAKLTGDQFALSMDSIATSMNYAKNSIGAAFAQVLNAVAPIINQLVDWLVTGINYVQAFFAAIGGQSTYMRAKKVAQSYGGVGNAIGGIGGAAGGATAAVEELQEQLSVLDFDELNQLQAQPTPSSGGSGGGGGGGGGGGSATPDYGSMFERATIGNDIQKMASWLKENFDDILDVVKAIGMGILGWKLATAFSNAIKELTGLQKFGIALMFTGFTLEALGAYDLGYEGPNLANVLKTAIGAALGVAGSLLTFGTGPLGWTIGLAAAITVFATAYIKGKRDKQMDDIKDILQDRSVTYQVAIAGADDVQRKLGDVNALLTSVRELSLQADENLNNIAIGEELLRQISTFEGKVDLSAQDVLKLQGLTEAYNQLNLTDAVTWWTDVNGVIHTNAEELQRALDLYKQYAKVDALKGLITESSAKQMEAKVTMDQTEVTNKAYQDKINQLWNQLMIYMKGNNIGGVAMQNWSPGEAVNNPVFGADPYITATQELINKLYENQQGYQQTIDTASTAYDEAGKKIEGYANELAIVTGEIQTYGQTGTSKTSKGGDFLSQMAQFIGGIVYKGSSAANSVGKGTNTTNTTSNITNNSVTNTATYSAVGATQAAQATIAYSNSIKDVYTQEQIQAAAQKMLSQGYTLQAAAIMQGTQEGYKYLDMMYSNNAAMQQNATVVNDSVNRNLVQASALRTSTNAVIANGNAFGVSSGQVGGFSTMVTDALNPMNQYAISTGKASSIMTGSFVPSLIGAGNAAVTSSGQVGLINTAISKVGTGVNYQGIKNNISNNLNSSWYSAIGTNNIKSPIETQVNLTGKGVQGSKVLSATASAITSGQNYGGIGTKLKTAIEGTTNQTGQGVAGATIFNATSSRIGAQPFSRIGTNAKNDIEGTMNQTGQGINAGGIANNLIKVFDQQPWSNIGRNMARDIANGLNGNIGQIQNVIGALCNGMQAAANAAPWSNIGRTIGNDMRNGIRSAVNGWGFNVQVKVNGRTETLGGNVVVQMAEGGFPQIGSLFVAGEAGAEAVGTIGGKTGVANREQIASAIAMALKPMLGGRNESETIQVNTYLDSQVVARANAKGTKAMNRRYNITAKA